MTVLLREHVNRIILSMGEEEVIEIDPGSVNVRRAPPVGMADRKRVRRRNLIEVVEQRTMSIPRLVIE